MAKTSLPRFRFRLLTLLVGIGILCAPLAAWSFYTKPRLRIEPTDPEHVRIAGRFFMFDGFGREFATVSVFYTSPDRKLTWPASAVFAAKETSWSIYEFNDTIVMPMPEGRYDIRFSIGSSKNNSNRDFWFVFGDQNLPSFRSRSLGPIPKAPEVQDRVPAR